MKKEICLSLVTTLSMYATPIDLGTIDVEAKVDTEVIQDVSGEDIKSADLGEALFKQSPSVSMVRRSGVANDIIVRGQKKDNINVTIDGVKIYGACPNRMDPPISHILTNNVDYIELDEGPFNVEDFGVLSADVKIYTIKPTEGTTGELNLGFGSWGYKKGAFSVSGGEGNVRFLLSGSAETSGQYKDSDGNDFAGQIRQNILDGLVPGAAEYKDPYKDMDAYSKKTMMAKLFWDITDNQELRLSYTANRSDNILYPNTPMDAMYDDSDIFNIEYTAKDLGTYSKALDIQLYNSTVDHPMSNFYRMSSAMMGEKTHKLDAMVQGAKIKNNFEMGNHSITMGVDYTFRNWDGQMFTGGTADVLGMPGMRTIWDVDTKNYGFFAKDKITMDKLEVDLGLRYDDTSITSEKLDQPDNDYNELTGYIFGTYHANENTKYFAGAGRSSRVPDARELYIIMSGNVIGNSDLKNTLNHEFDLGAEKKYENATVKAKVFYSNLKDYIAYNSTQNHFENVDATIWGFEVSGSYVFNEALYTDFSVAQQNGKKKDALTGQSDKDLAEIPPFKYNVALNYQYDESLLLRAEVIGAGSWSHFDADNGEQKLDAYTVLNLKGTKEMGKNFEVTVGVDNVLDSSYAVSNTYKDLTLLQTGGDVMLLNEPGRYVYTNIKYKF